MSRRWVVPAIPFLLSFSLSAATLGTSVGWQDSGFFLTGIKEVSVLYPPGFVLYLLLARLWTTLLFFVDFTLAVHLFSSLCAALAAATMALAARDLLRSRGPLFRVAAEDPGDLADWVGMLTGLLTSTGYTFWASALMAKGYAFYYLVLSLLLWRMIRADDSGRPRDFTIVAVLIGLAWQAHPSATNTGLALSLFVLFHRRVIGSKGIVWRIALSAAIAIAPVLLLPILSARDTITAFGAPDSPGAILEYLRGDRFTRKAGAWGWDGTRALSAGSYFWEEMLGIGTLAVAFGLARIARVNRRLLFGLAAWVLPVLLVTLLFKIEGQHDHWFVAAWLPLQLAGSVGLWALAIELGKRGRAMLAGAGLVAVGWSAFVNGPLLTQRGYDLAEVYGRLHLDHIHEIDRDAIVVLNSDDTAAICQYLQVVKGRYPGILIVRAPRLADRWYVDRLLRRDPRLRRSSEGAGLEGTLAGFVDANAGQGRPIFFERPPSPESLRPDLILIPSGTLWKVVPRRGEPEIDLRYWRMPVTPEMVRSQFRRARGQRIVVTAARIDVTPEPYERRLLAGILRSFKLLADWQLDHGRARSALDLYSSLLANDPDLEHEGAVVYPYAIAHYALGNLGAAELLLRRALSLELTARDRSRAHFCLGEILEKSARGEEALLEYRRALAVPGGDPTLPEKIKPRLKTQ